MFFNEKQMNKYLFFAAIKVTTIKKLVRSLNLCEDIMNADLDEGEGIECYAL